jgi:predicted nucleic acid-binding protein
MHGPRYSVTIASGCSAPLIVVDTGVWVAVPKQPILAETLAELIEVDEVLLALPVRLELLGGSARHQRKALLRIESKQLQVRRRAESREDFRE